MNGALRILAPALLLFAAACATTPEPARAGARAEIRAVEGSADVWRHGQWQRARAGQRLAQGDRARTGADGKIHFHLGRYGGVVTLMPNSQVEFERIGRTSPEAREIAVLKLTEGRVLGDTLRLPPNTVVVVKTPGGTFQIP